MKTLLIVFHESDMANAMTIHYCNIIIRWRYYWVIRVVEWWGKQWQKSPSMASLASGRQKRSINVFASSNGPITPNNFQLKHFSKSALSKVWLAPGAFSSCDGNVQGVAWGHPPPKEHQSSESFPPYMPYGRVLDPWLKGTLEVNEQFVVWCWTIMASIKDKKGDSHMMAWHMGYWVKVQEKEDPFPRKKKEWNKFRRRHYSLWLAIFLSLLIQLMN